eukprot:TRINITY_DN102871_c0_g1_i1.p1 TRINITY_DN102871_c0_g1~~TRINITY_DN102871_c0_g1_i1.p1  ORF type:complete len:332 (+),score=67.72 TRINITY_DN102871_c0_g1_i1:109-1104(+)
MAAVNRPQPMLLPALILLLRCVSVAGGGFLFVSAPRESKVSFVKLPGGSDYNGLSPLPLVDQGLAHPQGLAVDQKRKRLYVADPDVQKIYSYNLIFGKDSVRTDGKQTIVAQGAESRWVALDGVGNVFFSDEPRNLILKVAADKVLRGEPSPEIVYNGTGTASVNQPGGIAVDNFHVYWTNKHFGQEVGTVVRGSENPGATATVSVLARNLVKSYGICLSLGNIYYTAPESRLYGVKKTGGDTVEVSSTLTHPRGCAYDGDGTVYVADRGAGAVYAFAGNMPTITNTQLTKAFDAEDAFGLAVAIGAAAPQRHMFLGALAVSLTAMLAAHM